MILRRIHIPWLLLLTLATFWAHAAVHMPDPNLRAVVREHLNIGDDAAITQTDMLRLAHLAAYNAGITDLSGLDAAVKLRHIAIGDNPLSDLSPLAHMPQLTGFVAPNCHISGLGPLSHLPHLEELNLRNNPISDISPLAQLTSLKYLDLSRCQIVDIAPLANLINLEVLQLNHNQINNIRSLAVLTSLKKLEIHYNIITDHSLLDALSLEAVYYDQVCEMPALPVRPRIENRTYPSIHTRYRGPIRNRPDLTPIANAAHFDLDFYSKPFGLRVRQLPDNTFDFAGDLDSAIAERDQLLAHNPHRIDLVDVGIRAAPLSYFPEDSPYWVRDEDGNIVIPKPAADGGTPTALLDFTLPAVQDRIVEQAIAVDKCGLYDGIFFDYWSETWTVLLEYRTMEQEQRARDVIVRRIRANTHPDFLIMGNTNDQIIPRTAPYINGGFMESVVPFHKTGARLEEDLIRVENSLRWLENNSREPRINALDGFVIPTESLDSPNNLRWMRAITTLSLTHSDGYVAYDPRHLQDLQGTLWYGFWDADLGRPVGEKGQLYQETDGLYIREFTNGWAVYNHSGEAQVITLPEEAQGVATELRGTEHALANLDGEMYLRIKPANPADVNGDGVVNILDLVVVAQAIGPGDGQGDVNGDGAVNVFDLVMVAGAF